MKLPYSVFFLSFDEKNAEENWQTLRSCAPRAQRVHGVAGILNAHRACAEKSETENFFVVDGDNEVLGFDFSFVTDQPEAIHVWRCRNAVNDLVYGYGAIKLYPRWVLANAALRVDLATSASPAYRIMPKLASVTKFNTSPLAAWRAGFRECVKLASQALRNQNRAETEEWLEAWCSRGEEKPFGDWCIAGARAGREYGRENRDNAEALARINDYRWLEERFRRESGSTAL